MHTSIEIRPLSTIPEFRACVDLQRAVWGFDEVDLLPLRFFVVISHIGGQVFGAFTAQGKMIAFLCALSGMKGKTPYLHSQMLAVEPEYRNQGLARRLKLVQRQDALARGYQLIEWTFDPLELKNAYFNIEKLGAIVRRFSPDHYGSTSSHLQAGLPTDRMFAEWWIQHDRVKNVLGEIPNPSSITQGERPRVDIPNDIGEWKSRDLSRACSVQRGIREKIMGYFQQGYTITHFERGPQYSSYILTKGSINIP